MNSKNMNAAVLFSGGKDSVYALHLAKLSGFNIKCLITMIPESNESMLFHYPFTGDIDYNMVLGLPCIKSYVKNDNEISKLREALEKAKSLYNLSYIITGAIASDFQRFRINFVCEELSLKTFSPLWHKNQKNLIEEEIEILKVQIVSITSFGLAKELLNFPIDKNSLQAIFDSKPLSNKAFEGGEAETLVLDAPEYKYEIKLTSKEIVSESENQHYLKAKPILLRK
ncbi:MAG: diphthine-ammonia ligase [Candidatus Woesearchaeota archaeon]|nr:diphthine-ammonia ligase [Candidatus Woesearchaeota archaeon]